MMLKMLFAAALMSAAGTIDEPVPDTTLYGVPARAGTFGVATDSRPERLSVARDDTTSTEASRARRKAGDFAVVSLIRSEESFTSPRSNWREVALSVRVNATAIVAAGDRNRGEAATRRTVMAFDAGRAKRFGQHQSFVGIDFYQSLSRRTYGNVRVRVGPGAIIIPRADAMLEFTGATASGWEGSVGYRQMRYRESSVHIYSAAGARYYGRWYIRGRVSVIPVRGSLGAAALLTTRRYLGSADESFEIVVANGREVVTGFDDIVIDVRRSLSGLVRGQYFPTGSVGLQGGIGFTRDGDLSRWSIILGLLTRI